MTEPTWTIDAPGQWTLDLSHTPAGTTLLTQAIMTRSMPAGMRRMFRDLGAPIDTLDARFLHGCFYTRLRPLIGADKPPRKLPPTPILKIAARLHPEMRRRARTAASTISTEPWKQVIDDWHRVGRGKV